MLSKDVLCVDLSQYMEENWPLGDEELERTNYTDLCLTEGVRG